MLFVSEFYMKIAIFFSLNLCINRVTTFERGKKEEKVLEQLL